MLKLVNKSVNTNMTNGVSIEQALDFAVKDPLKNALVISNLTQLQNDCNFALRNSSANNPAVASLDMDMPFNSIALMADSETDVMALINELSRRYAQLENQPIYGLFSEEITKQIESSYRVTQKNREIQLTISDVEIPGLYLDADRYRLEKLTTRDLSSISQLYGVVPAMDWTPKLLSFGPYFGIYYKEFLVSTAGVQFATQWVSEIGNIVTHPNYLRQNLAYHCTKAVVDCLRDISDNIFLNVIADNHGAIKLYEKMGFVKTDDLFLVQFYVN
ncbi:MAG: GNAT family N-acetyltransferase [candidate division Zixibacteria bacterium]|nr:GNAT family N-acetyltransferase [candidate division Zixibacteria bacterium]